jgi:hypothetical protein
MIITQTPMRIGRLGGGTDLAFRCSQVSVDGVSAENGSQVSESEVVRQYTKGLVWCQRSDRAEIPPVQGQPRRTQPDHNGRPRGAGPPAVTFRDRSGRVWAVRDDHERAERKTAQQSPNAPMITLIPVALTRRQLLRMKDG